MKKKSWKKWSDKEILILQHNYKLSRQQLEKLFPDRTWASIILKSNQLSLPRIKYRIMIDPIIRFFEKVDKTKDGCWLWIGGISDGGYGVFDYNGKSHNSHKWLYERNKKRVPKNKQLDHLCRNRACVNPDHLEIVTFKQNILRGISPSAINAKKTHCKKGHILDGDNLYINPTNARVCKTCRKNSQESFKLRKQIQCV